MNQIKTRYGILGIGNLLLSDEGFGVHVVRSLEENYQFPESVDLLDAGTAGIYLAPFLEEHDTVLVIDVIAMTAAPGSIHWFKGDELRASGAHGRMSPHQLGFLEILDICRLRNAAPAELEFYCAVPEDLNGGLELSDTVAPQVAKVCQQIVRRLEADGLHIRQVVKQDA
ncbi:MAG: HyaD/HybD family hydrogenase maturation endopeptidase [Desulfobulbaceae bacterium]|uniref:HyaD/HybD family hydrogenase maturation endopeptidase n=1 Tax=Candidatus Desulfatifera sulfidica TaxID=2841691 RepID=A0A8J6NA75_9BACT|nr:HyaD/HybD family hydrogenase maturation endopeptidase [Candidatus Desulfatifera sulfidica]